MIDPAEYRRKLQGFILSTFDHLTQSRLQARATILLVSGKANSIFWCLKVSIRLLMERYLSLSSWDIAALNRGANSRSVATTESQEIPLSSQNSEEWRKPGNKRQEEELRNLAKGGSPDPERLRGVCTLLAVAKKSGRFTDFCSYHSSEILVATMAQQDTEGSVTAGSKRSQNHLCDYCVIAPVTGPDQPMPSNAIYNFDRFFRLHVDRII